MLIAQVGPLQCHARWQHLFRQGGNNIHCLCGREYSRIELTSQIRCWIAVVAQHRVWAEGLPDIHHRTDGHHLPLVITGTQPGDIFYAGPERCVRLGDHLPGTAKAVEVIHIGRAKIGLQGVEQFGQRHTLGLGPQPIHLRIQLRHVGLIAADWKAHPRRLRNRTLELIDRLLQRAIAKVAAILYKQLKARPIAQAQDRRRHKGECKAFFQAANALVDAGIYFRSAQAALTKGAESKKSYPGVGSIGELQRVKAGKGNGVLHAFGLHGDVHHVLKHLIGSLQRRTFRQNDARNQIKLVLHWNKAGWHRLEHHPGAQQQQRVDHKHRATMLQGAGYTALVLVGAGVKETVEGPEDPAE